MSEPADPTDPFIDATAQAALVRSGAVSPVELVDAAIARIERLDPQLNAVIHPRFERGRAEAAGSLPDGPFRGVPLLFKDLDGMQAGEPYHGGSAFLKRHGFVPTTSCTLNQRFVDAGFVVLGRTNAPELGLVPTTEPAVYGPTRNPWDLDRSPGGSSGGSAAAVASGMVPVAHAGDGGGSIRIPAAFCGLVGLKPTRGRTTLGPGVGEAWAGHVVRGAVTRSVRDTAAVLDAVSGAAPGDPYAAEPPARPYVDELDADPGRLHIGAMTDVPGGVAQTTAEARDAVAAVAGLLEDLGHDVGDDRPAALEADSMIEDFTVCYTSWVAAEIADLERAVGATATEEDFEPATWMAAELGRSVTAAQYIAALRGLHTFTRQVTGWWADGNDLLLTPTVPEKPHLLGTYDGTADDPMRPVTRATEIVPFCAPFNTTGQPAISVPVHWTDDDLPIGVQIVAAPGREDRLIQVAAQLEAAAPWAHRRPPVSA